MSSQQIENQEENNEQVVEEQEHYNEQVTEKEQEKEENQEEQPNEQQEDQQPEPDSQQQQETEQLKDVTKRVGTQGEVETTTQRKDQNRRLETEKQFRQKTTTERTFKTLEQVYSKRNTNSLLFFRTADQFDTKIIHDQINRSHAKQQYTFSKAERFSRAKESYCSIQFYDSQVQTQLGKRSAALGYGNKSDFTKRDKYIPGPTDYSVKLPGKPGVKFAFGREETLIKGIHGRANRNPAPNLYEVKDVVTQIKYSLGERTSAKRILLSIIDIYLQSTTPAPGRYDIGGFSSKGSYFIGKYRSSCAPMISPSTAQSTRIKRVPGPGAYDPPGDIGDARTYLPSQYSTRSGFRFGFQDRQTQEIKNKKFPGPGTYQLPSEFGDYEYPPLI